MSLISDPDFLLHRVRLAYLRVIDDPYAARVATFTPDYALNPHILAAGLADPDRWPELAQPHSPPPSPPPSPTDGSHNGKSQSDRHDNASPGRHRPRREPRRHSGFPGATGLKYSQTIVGPTRTGAMGLGVSRRRTSTARPRMSSLSASGSVKIDVQPASPTLNGETGFATPDASESVAVRGRMRADSEPTPGGAGVSDDVVEEKGRKRRSSEAEALATTSLSPKTNIAHVSPSAPNSPSSTSAVQTPTTANTTPKAAPPPFIPKFKIDPRVEAQRKMRMNARAQAQAAHNQPNAVVATNTSNLRSSLSSFTAPPQQKTVTIVNPDTSSDEEEDDNKIDEESESTAMSDSDDDDSDSLRVAGDPDDEADDFNPDFAAPRAAITSDSASEVASVEISVSSASASHSSFASSPPLTQQHHPQHSAHHGHHMQVPHRSGQRTRLSPVSESRIPEADTEFDSAAEPPTPSRSVNGKGDGGTSAARPPIPPRSPSRPSFSGASTSTPAKSSPEPLFARRPVPPRPSSASIQPSFLTTLLASSSTSTPNPFSELYALVSGRAESESYTLIMYFPFSDRPTKPMECVVRKDAIVEEVVGFALWRYWEEEWSPQLDEGVPAQGEGEEKDPKLTANGWVLRVTEDDGEVDEDMPDLSRLIKISKLKFPGYAIVPASTSQINSNKADEVKIQRHPSRMMAPKKAPSLPKPATAPPTAPAAELAVPAAALAPSSVSGPSTSAIGLAGSILGGGGASLGLPHSLGPSSSHGPQVFLRIRVEDTHDAVHVSTTIPVSAGMYMQEALELVCKKRKIQNPREWALLLSVTKPASTGPPTTPDPEKPSSISQPAAILIPLDRTVASLQGKSDLLLVKRSMLGELGVVDLEKNTGRTTDPNASIFKRVSEVPEENAALALLNSAYKKYTVFKKTSMLVTRQERVLAIDGDYIHIMPSGKRAVFDSGRTISFHIKSVVACQQSSKSSAMFKLEVGRDSGNPKRYDFEAESSKLAREIQDTIRSLKLSSQERTGTLPRSRRSRHVS